MLEWLWIMIPLLIIIGLAEWAERDLTRREREERLARMRFAEAHYTQRKIDALLGINTEEAQHNLKEYENIRTDR